MRYRTFFGRQPARVQSYWALGVGPRCVPLRGGSRRRLGARAVAWRAERLGPRDGAAAGGLQRAARGALQRARAVHGRGVLRRCAQADAGCVLRGVAEIPKDRVLARPTSATRFMQEELKRGGAEYQTHRCRQSAALRYKSSV